MATTLTSDQVNYLIWRYLQEAGFRDSALAFERDSRVERLDEYFKSHIGPGKLVYLIQRGLLYEELAAQIDRDGTRKPGKTFEFLPITPASLEDEGVGSDSGPTEDGEYEEESVTATSKSPSSSATRRKHSVIDEGHHVNGAPKKKRKKVPAPHTDEDVAMTDVGMSPPTVEERVTNGPDVGVQIEEDAIEIRKADTIIVGTEDTGVEFCAWNPANRAILATGAKDSATRIWDIPEGAAGVGDTPNLEIQQPPSTGTKSIRITAMQWNKDGTRLATGFLDGHTRIWTLEGNMEHNMASHCAPVQELRFNAPGTHLMALSADGKVVIYDVREGDTIKTVVLQDEEVVSADWISKTQVMVGGEKGTIGHIDISKDKPLTSFPAHTGEISFALYDDTSLTAATGGTDSVIMLWSKPFEQSTPTATLLGHEQQIIALAWQPVTETDPFKPSPSASRILVSASNDCTIRVWNSLTHECLRVVKLHVDPVDKLAFAPDGIFVASQASGQLFVWEVMSGKLKYVSDRRRSRQKNGIVALESGEGEIRGLCWDPSGLRLAIAEGPHKCAILRLPVEQRQASKAITAHTNGMEWTPEIPRYP